MNNDGKPLFLTQDFYRCECDYYFLVEALTLGVDLNDYPHIEFGSHNADTLLGDESHSRIYAGDGNDTLDGGKGNDVLEGGEGSDVYRFNYGALLPRVHALPSVTTSCRSRV